MLLYVTLKIKDYGCSYEPTNITHIYAGTDYQAALAAIDKDFDEEVVYMNGDSCQNGEYSYMIDDDTDEKITYQILKINTKEEVK